MADEPKSKAKSGNSPADFHVKQLETRAKNVQHKIDNRIKHFPIEQRDQAKERAERDLAALKKLIAKAKS